MNELDFIKLVGRFFPSATTSGEGIGDDCAVIPISSGESLTVTTDMLVENVHFRLSTTSPRQLGHKSLAVNLSDIASMGARPIASFMSIARPSALTDKWYEEFIEGYHELSERYRVPLMGGDTTSADGSLAISVTLLGTTAPDHIKRRSAAEEGDAVMVCGTLGDSAAGLYALENGLEGFDSLKKAHLEPSPLVEEGLWLGGETSVHAMTDISDGVAKDLRQICDCSGMGAEVELSELPLSQEMLELCDIHGLDPEKTALCGGEDFKLLFTVKESEAEMLCRRFKETFGYAPRRIGRMVSKAGIGWLKDGIVCDKEFNGYIHR